MQSGAVSDIGKVKLPSGKERVEVKLLADSGWIYVCSVPSVNYLHNLKSGDHISTRPDETHVHVDHDGHRYRLKIIDVDRWAQL